MKTMIATCDVCGVEWDDHRANWADRSAPLPLSAVTKVDGVNSKLKDIADTCARCRQAVYNAINATLLKLRNGEVSENIEERDGYRKQAAERAIDAKRSKLRAEKAERERDEARAEIEKLRAERWFVAEGVAGSTPAGASTGGGVEAADGERGEVPSQQVRREEHPTFDRAARSFYDAVKAFEAEHPDDGWPVRDLDLMCDAFDIAMRAIEHGFGAPIPVRLHCPECGELHVDAGEFATRAHHTHACQLCGATWRPAVVPTVGVRYLPGFKDAAPEPADAPLAGDRQPHELTLDAVQDAALRAIGAVDGPARAALQAFASAIEAEKADLAAGYPPKRWICPCGASHSRGHFPIGQIGSHRCMRCGYVGTEGVMGAEDGGP